MRNVGHLLLRAGVAFAFLFPAIDAIFDPFSWEGYFPSFVHQLPIDTLLLLHSFGAVEVVLALWLLSGRNIRIPAVLMALMLLLIVALNWFDFAVLFRDVAIALAALALAFLPTPTTHARTS